MTIYLKDLRTAYQLRAWKYMLPCFIFNRLVR